MTTVGYCSCCKSEGCERTRINITQSFETPEPLDNKVPDNASQDLQYRIGTCPLVKLPVQPPPSIEKAHIRQWTCL